jgi:hypoxanthine-guanine phosphoribosyltransferase
LPEPTERQRFEELVDITRSHAHVAHPPRSGRILLFGDVLNSGRHFKVTQQLLAQRFPDATILGVFLARCLPDPSVEFEAL